MGLSTARANKPLLAHFGGWLVLAALLFLPAPGQVAADTKLDLHVNPAGFLAGALDAYSATFTMGQLQNQAYGYLFPQGLFFLIFDFLPDWIAQRGWWLIVTGVGFSGFLFLLRQLKIGPLPYQVVAAFLFALSPRTLTTLTTISSETWPIMLAPWLLAAVLRPRLDSRALALAVLPVACMGAVNAAATLLACLPAGIVLMVRIFSDSHRRQAILFGLSWLAGCLLVSLWWIVPLLVLGRYSAPFTEFIESAFVTTRWLNPAEILRGTTSWAPFVDVERSAGVLLVGHPVFVLVTMAVAGLGLVGLCQRDLPRRSVWVILLLCGFVLLGTAASLTELYDGLLAPFRNLHKADLLVRIPLLVGLAHLGSFVHQPKRYSASAVLIIVAIASLAPAWSGRLLPQGTWEEIPEHVSATADYLNTHAADTRTLIAPQTSFARQDWGWTRDEPLQPLLEVPWATRDAIPLVSPEMIRGLDGLMAVLEHTPEHSAAALEPFGIGAVVIRHDLEEGLAPELDTEAIAASSPDSEIVDLGDYEVVMFHHPRSYFTNAPLRIDGGGEVIGLASALTDAPLEISNDDPHIVTDTPLAVARNYGTLDGAVSAPLAREEEGADIHNRLRDYPSEGSLVGVEERGASVHASSSAADASAFGGADAARSVTAAVDKQAETAWWPAPGEGEGQWLELRGVHGPDELTVEATDDTQVIIHAGESQRRVTLSAEESATVALPAPATGTVRIELSERVGLREASLANTPVQRIIPVTGAGDSTGMFILQRMSVDTGVIIRSVELPRAMNVVVDGDAPIVINGEELEPGSSIELEAGRHEVMSEGWWVSLTEEGFSPAVDGPSLWVSGVSENEGLEAGDSLTPRTIGAGMQAFEVSSTTDSAPTLSFVGTTTYRIGLWIGIILLLVTCAACLWVLSYRPGRRHVTPTPGELPAPAMQVMGALALTAVAGIPGLITFVLVYLIRRFTLITPGFLSGILTAFAGAWLARAPWPSSPYAGDSSLLGLLVLAAVACVVIAYRRR